MFHAAGTSNHQAFSRTISLDMTSPLDSSAVAQYLETHPQFFEEQIELLSKIRLPSVLGGRTLSLQERQMDVLREKIKAFELRLAGLMRIGQENDQLADRFQAWTRSLLLARNDIDLPHVLTEGLRTVFGVPHATLRLWGTTEACAHTWYAGDVSADARIFANGLATPFCGANNDFEAAGWLDDATSIASIAILPLRLENGDAFGLLVLGSPEAERFSADMGTDFLTRIGATSSAALHCLLA
jgi:uncharacterized protein YigA (DUF484 family)